MKNMPPKNIPQPETPDPGAPPWAPEDVLEHSAWLRTFARALVPNAHDAEDLVQGAFGVAAAAKEEVRDLRAFLSGTVKRLATRLAREKRHRKDREWSHAVERSKPVPAADQSLETMDTMRVVLQEVSQLPAAQGRCIALRYVEGLEVSEIAQRLGIESSTVRSNLARGLEALRQRLDVRYGDRPAWSALLVPMALTGSVPAANPPSQVASAAASNTAVTGLSAAAVLFSAMNIKLVLATCLPLLAAWGAFSWIEGPDGLTLDSTQIAGAESPTASRPMPEVKAPQERLESSDLRSPGREELAPAAAAADPEGTPATASLGVAAALTIQDAFSSAPLFDYLIQVTPLDDDGSPTRSASEGDLIVATDANGDVVLGDLPAGTTSVALKSLLRDDDLQPVTLSPGRVSLAEPEVVYAMVGPTYRFALEGAHVDPNEDYFAVAFGPGTPARMPYSGEFRWSAQGDLPIVFARFGNAFGSIGDTGPWTLEIRDLAGHRRATAEVGYGRGTGEELIPLRFETCGAIRFVTETGAPGRESDMAFITVTSTSTGAPSYTRMRPGDSGGVAELGLLTPGIYRWEASGQVDANGAPIMGECDVDADSTVTVEVPALAGPYQDSFAIVDASAVPDANLSGWEGGIVNFALVDTLRLVAPERAPELGPGMWRMPIGPVPQDGWSVSLNPKVGYDITPRTAILSRSAGPMTFTVTPTAAPVTVQLIFVDASSGQPVHGANRTEAMWLRGTNIVEIGHGSTGALEPVEVPSNRTAQFICRAEGYQATEAIFQPGNGGGELTVALQAGWRNRVIVYDMATLGPYPGASVIVDGVNLGDTDEDGSLWLDLEGPPELIELGLADEAMHVKMSPFRDGILWSDDPLEGYRFVVERRD